MRTVHVRTAAALLLAVAASRAEAFPAFARKYGMSCTACPVAWPILHQVGQNFRDNGYQFGLGKDDPVALNPSYIPVAIRTTAAYQYTETTNVPSASGPITTRTGGVPVPPGVDVLSGGTIAEDLSFLVVLTGFSPSDNAAFAESAWVRLDHLGGSNWANLRIGKFELDEPASAHRNVTLTGGYAVYGAHGGAVAFDMSQNQVGVELDGHDARSATRYAISLTSANGGEGLSRNAWSSPLLYGHVQQAFETGSDFLSWVRVGLLGALGWWPTVYEYGANGAAISGTGRVHKQFSRVGAEVSGIFGNPATPLLATAVWMQGREDAGLGAPPDPAFPSNTDPTAPSLTYSGGFLELDWVPWADSSYNASPWMFFGRYDVLRYKSGVPGDTDGFTVGARRYLAVGPRASAAIHVEYSHAKVKGVGAPDPDTGLARDQQTQAVLAGIDFDF